MSLISSLVVTFLCSSALLSKSNGIAVSRQGAPSTAAAVQASIAVSLVVGTPGSGHAAVLAAVRDYDAKNAGINGNGSGSGSGAYARWVTAVLGGGGDVFEMDQARAAATLDEMVAEVGRQRASASASTSAAPLRVLVVVSTYAGVVPVVEMMQRVLFERAAPSPSFHLSSVSTLLHASGFFVGPSYSLTYPGVLDQLVPGYTASVLLLTPPAPTSTRDTDLVAAVRARIRTVLGGATDLRVAAQGARIAFKDVQEMLLSAHFTKRVARRRRNMLRLMTSPSPASGSGSGSVPRGLAVSSAVASAGSVHFFHLSPLEFLFDRSNFLHALLRFSRHRAVYYCDAERADEDEHARVKLARLVDALDAARGGGKAAASSSASSVPASSHASSGAGGGRIVFTTSSDSLPSSHTVLHVSALVKFEDAASNAGGCSHEYLLLQAANGTLVARPISFDTDDDRKRNGERSTAAAAAAQLAQQEQFDDDDEERKEGDDATASASPAPVQDDDPGCPIPLSTLPLDIAQFVRANPAALIPTTVVTTHATHSSATSSSSSSSVAGASPLSTSRTSCMLLVYGCGLDRADVRRDLLHPSIRNARSYEKIDSRWNAEVKRQLADINKV